jgi:siroheme synthase
LLSLGMAADTPATWITRVSLPGQAILQSTLGELQSLPARLAGQPAILLLGTAAAAPGGVLPCVADSLQTGQDIHATIDC